MTEQIQEVIPEPTQPEVISATPPNNNPLKIILFVILGAFILGGAVFAAYTLGKKSSPPIIPPQAESPTALPTQVTEPTAIPTSDETTNWKTYSSSEYKFSLGYPDLWDLVTDTVLSGNSSEGVIFEVRAPGTKMDHGLLDGGSFLVDLIKPYGNLTLKQIIEERTKYYKSARVTSHVLSGVTGFLVEIDSNQESGQTWPSREIYFEKGNWIYNIVYQTNKGQEVFSTFDQILSTFKFVD